MTFTLTRRHFAFGIAAAFVGSQALAAPTRVDNAGLVVIGGIEQWISIRGEDSRNPVIFVVHGGPGESQWLEKDGYAAWEKRFTVVQWDQRGAGLSITDDGIEVAEHVRAVLGKDRIVLLDHAPGASVAIGMTEKRPDLFAAYVAAGQAPRTASAFAMPVILIHGRDGIGDSAFDAIRAPKKAEVLIDGAGRSAFVNPGDRFLAAFNGKVRPIAVSRGA